MSLYLQQYQPLTTVETDTDDALSCRVRDQIFSINNAKLVFSARLSLAWPELPATGLTDCCSVSGDTNENIILVVPQIQVGSGYNRLHWSLSAERISGTGDTTWKLYAGRNSYTGPRQNVSSSDFATMGVYTTGTITVNSDSETLYHNTDIELDAESVIPAEYIYYVVTAQAAAATQSTVFALAITPWISTA